MENQGSQEVIQKLLALNSDELLYRAYYAAKGKESTLAAFLAAQDVKVIRERNILIPELLGEDLCEAIEQKERFDTSYIHGVEIRKHDRYMPPYAHSGQVFEIFYVLNGRCLLTIFQKSIHLTQGDLCIISPSTTQSLEVNDDESILMKIRVSTSAVSDLLSLMLRSENPVSSFFFHSLHSANHQDYLLFHTAEDSDIQSRILEMYQDSLIEDQYTKHLLNNLLNVFFIKLVRSHSPVEFPASPKTDDRFRVVYYLINHFTDVTLEDVAREFNFSVGYCSRYIKSVTGYTFSQLKTKLIFEYVARRLVTTNDSITDLSIGMGYENPENFIRAFKKYYHMTPTEYRKLHR